MISVENTITRRRFLGLGIATLLSALLKDSGGYSSESFNGKEKNSMTEREQATLDYIESLAPYWPEDAELGISGMPRKMVWEQIQAKKILETYESQGDESDWLAHIEIMEEIIKVLAEAGIKRIRVALLPFEFTKDGVEFDWNPLKVFLELLAKYNVRADISVGPFSTFEYPGARFPDQLRDQITAISDSLPNKTINVDIEPDENAPELSETLKTYGFRYLEEFLAQCEDNPIVDKIYLGNEWPDVNGIEGNDASVSLGRDLMLEYVKFAKAKTTKPLAINTNINVADFDTLEETLGFILDELGERGVLGFDIYYTQEQKIPRLAQQSYKENLARIRERFPQTRIISTEFQAEPWPEGSVRGAWAEIYRDHKQLIEDYLLDIFPKTLMDRLIAGGIGEAILWTNLLPILYEMGYTFPVELTRAIADSMAKRPALASEE